MDRILILGAGIAGLGAAKTCKKKGLQPVVLEQRNDFGGLAGNFVIDGFRFDRFVHFSFSKSPQVLEIFNHSAGDILTHVPNPYNIYHRKWIKHPAQNNLFPLGKDEKDKIIHDFLHRPQVDMSQIFNYEQWLRVQFGNYFAEHFPMVYTRKYWMCEARDLETKWVGKRVYQPSVEEVIEGSKTADTPVTYYAKEMRYPKYGGFRAFFSELAEGTDIRYNEEVTAIDTVQKVVKTSQGHKYPYDHLCSSIPLPEYARLLNDVPEYVLKAIKQLKCTSGYHISIALKTKDIPPYLWWYIYDEDILAARVYSPSLKSPDNAPEGCSSLQMEVYCEKDQYTEDELLAGTVGKLIEAGIIRDEDVLFTHVGFEPYANVVFTEPIYRSRKVIRDYLSSIGIETIGRFGEWDYLWSDQSLLSGLKVKV